MASSQEAALRKRIVELERELANANRVIQVQATLDAKNHALYNSKLKDFQKIAIAFDTVRQVMMRSSAALNLDNINPLVVIKSTSTVYNSTNPQTNQPK